MRRLARLNIVLLSGLLMSCASIEGPVLGDGVTISPGWTKLKQRLMQTAQQPAFWAPLAAAAVLQVDDQDNRLTERLREDTPLFGSTQDALDASDDLRDLTELGYVATALAVPTNQESSWLGTKSKLLLTEWAGVEATHAFTSSLKESTDRERPDGSNRRSFPSGHASRATVQARFAVANTEYLPLQESTKMAMDIGFNSLAIGTAWARVEAGKHHPSDVLAGWSLGYLVSELTRVFLVGDKQSAQVSTQVSSESWQITYWLSF